MSDRRYTLSGFPLPALLRALLIGALLLAASASLPLLAAEPSARLGAVSGTVAVVHADGTAVQPAGPETALGPGDRVATVGASAATITLPGAGQIELGAGTTVVLRELRQDGATLAVAIELVQGTTIHRLGGISGLLDYRIVDPSGQATAHARGEAVFGVARDENGNVTAGCERCTGGVLTFPTDRDRLTSGWARTFTARGDVLDEKRDGSLYDALARGADADDRGGKTPAGNRLPAGQRTGSRDRRPRLDNDDDNPNQSLAAAPTATTTATATVTPTISPTATPTRTVISVFATISNFVYLPDPIVIKAGQTVRWTNLDDEVHTVTADNLSFTSPRLNQGDTFTMTFAQPGTYTYFCEPHPFMHGVVDVQ